MVAVSQAVSVTVRAWVTGAVTQERELVGRAKCPPRLNSLEGPLTTTSIRVKPMGQSGKACDLPVCLLVHGKRAHAAHHCLISNRLPRHYFLERYSSRHSNTFRKRKVAPGLVCLQTSSTRDQKNRGREKY